MARSVSIPCPDCGTVLEFTKGMWGWQKAFCPKCTKHVEPKEVKNGTAYCETCSKEVAVDLFAETERRCPNCRGPLTTALKRKEMRTVVCASCGGSMQVAVDVNLNGLKCVHCGEYVGAGAKAPAVAQKEAEAIRIRNAAMPDCYVLWRHQGSCFSANSLICPEPGTQALLVSGTRCIAVVSESGKRLGDVIGSDKQMIDVSVIFVRIELKRVLLAGTGKLSIADRFNRIKSGVNVPTNCQLKLRIADVARFAGKVGYRECTEQDLGLHSRDANITQEAEVRCNPEAPHIELDMERHLPLACRQTIRECGCEILSLQEYRTELSENFRKEAERELYDEWGLGVAAVTLNGLDITREKVEPIQELSIVNAIAQEIRWSVSDVKLHLENKPDHSAVISMQGTIQVCVCDFEKMSAHPDVQRWKRSMDLNEPIVKIRDHAENCIRGMLPSLLQGYINSSQLEIEELNLYIRGIIKNLTDKLSTDPVYPYLYNHGLQVDNLTVWIDQIAMSPLLERYYKSRIGKEALEIETVENDIEDTRDERNTDRAVRKTLRHLDAENVIAEAKEENERKARERAYSRNKQEEMYRHAEAMRDIENRAELQEMEDTVRMNEDRRGRAFQEEETNFERKMELDSARHNQLLTDLMINIESSKLSFQEKLEAYGRVKQMQDALTGADIRRTEAGAQMDVKRILTSGELQLSAEAQRIMRDAEAAAQELAERKAQAEAVRQMEVRRHSFEMEMEKLRLQEAMRENERAAEERMFAKQKEIEELKLMLSCYERQMARETDAARAAAAAETARLEAQREQERRRYEQKQREQAERDKAQRQRDERAEKDRRHLEKMMTEMRRLQSEINETRRNAPPASSDAVDKMDRLMGSMQDMMDRLNDSIQRNGGGYSDRREDDRRYASREDDRREDERRYASREDDRRDNDRAARPAVRQPGMRSEEKCPGCRSRIDPGEKYCPTCGFKL